MIQKSLCLRLQRGEAYGLARGDEGHGSFIVAMPRSGLVSELATSRSVADDGAP